jgi:PAS domain S-box-containing protein
MDNTLHILVIEDASADFRLIQGNLRQQGLAVECHQVATLDELKDAIGKGGWNVVLCDYNLPQLDFNEARGIVRKSHPDLPVILVSGSVGEERAVELLKQGISDFVLKDNMARLAPAIRRSLQEAADLRARHEAEAALRASRAAALNMMEDAVEARKRAEQINTVLQEEMAERTQVERALQESERRYRQLFDSIQDAIFVHRFAKGEPPGNFIEVNDIACRSLGYTREEMLRKSPFDIDPELGPSTVQKLDGKIAGGGPVLFERVHVAKDGHRIPVEISAQLFDLAGQKVVMIIARDITERKRAEEQLRKLSRAVEQSPASIVITDLDGSIEYVNPKFTEVTGYTMDEVLGKNPRVLKSEETAPEIYRTLWQTITQGCEWHGELHNKKKNGELFWEFASISPITGEAGRVTHFVAVKEDITGRKNMEAQLLQMQKMEGIGQLAGGVAHDFNNILAVIQMQADLLKMEDDLKPDQMACADEIVKASERAASLTRQLLLFSRRQVMQARDLDLNEAVAGITNMLRRILGEDIRIQITREPEALFIHADPGMMDQVLMNLAVNSRDAMPNGGRLTIETSRVEIDADAASRIPDAQPGAYACLTVMDNGTGINPEDLPRIFEPFFTTKDVGKGTGLGLATVFGIVRQHQGWIDVLSTPGVGTTFHIHLPLLSRKEDVEAPHSITAMRGGTETVLVAEDDSDLRFLIRSVLTQLGYRMIEASTGVEALRVWEENRDAIHLLLTDLVMPDGMSGIELAQRIKEDAPQLKVIYMSGYSPEIAAKNVSLQVGVDFLQKPFNAHSLATALRARLDA